jgi:competence protein ComEC
MIGEIATSIKVFGKILGGPSEKLARFSDEILSRLCQASVKAHSLLFIPREFLLIALAASGLLYLASKKAQPKVFALCFSTALAFRIASITHPRLLHAPTPASQVEQLDVGQGDAELILSPFSSGLIDTGSEHALSLIQWLDVLAQRKITRLDWIALTHLDEDHSGGVFQLAKAVPIGCVAVSQFELQTPRGIRFAERAKSLGLRVASYESPCFPYRFIQNHGSGANENMTSLWVPLKDGGFYLSMGDSDAKDEMQVVHAFGDELASAGPKNRILKASHHGSRFSTSLEMLKVVRPTEIRISSGVGNRFGHPSFEALNKFRQTPALVRRTDQEGALR